MIKLWLWMKVIWAALLARSNQVFYDRIASIYDLVFVSHRIHIENIVGLLSRIYPDKKHETLVLDLGCGTGMLSKALAEKGFIVIGLDISYESICILRKHGMGIDVIQADAQSIPISNECFNSVVCLGVWRHLEDTDRVLDEVCRILSKNGTFILGYFPPAVAGFFHVNQNRLTTLLIWLYQKTILRFGYVDRADFDLEEQTLASARDRFREVDKIVSGSHWHLLCARFPLIHSN